MVVEDRVTVAVEGRDFVSVMGRESVWVCEVEYDGVEERVPPEGDTLVDRDTVADDDADTLCDDERLSVVEIVLEIEADADTDVL